MDVRGMLGLRRARLRVTGALLALVGGAALAAPPMAAAQVQPYGTNNYGTFWNVLPPGTGGTENDVQLAAFEGTGARPPHFNDQLAMYHNLAFAAPNIQASSIGNYFKDATFGVPAGDLASSESPEPGVTIEFDKGFGVPHIYGDTRAALEYGIGWMTAQTRLFEIDALRHAGNGTLASFAGGANASMDESTWQDAPYTPQDLQAQITYMGSLPGGQQLLSDAQNYIAGVNAYIKVADADPLMLPGEYLALGKVGGAQPFTLSDIISTASLIGGQLGQGGGQQLRTAILYEQFRQRFGAERFNVAGSPEGTLSSHARPDARHRDLSGFGSFLSFIQPDDPLAPTTVHGTRFPYQTLLPTSATSRSTIALPDPGSVQWYDPVTAGSVPSGGTVGFRTPVGGKRAPVSVDRTGLLTNGGTGMFGGGFPASESNALLVSGRDTTTGHPVAVIGPQVAYWSPQILMEEDIHGPGIDANGASFPGTNVYVELGHGEDYAWSATSEGQNIIDTFAVPLCNPAGGSVAASSDYYLLGHRCVQMESLVETDAWTPNLADMTPAGSATFRSLRTAYGLVIARARIHGRPVVYTNLRSTYFHELDSALGFEQFNQEADMRTPQQFMNAAYKIGYTFNWFFVNSAHIAYFASGQNPVRASGTDPVFPSWASSTWKRYTPSATPNPSTSTEQDTPQSAHPQVVDQPYLTSWNNKPAHGYDFVDGEYSSVFRSQLLDNNINTYLRRGKLTLVDLINAMGNAATQDLRGVEVLPYALQIVGHPSSPAEAHAAAELRAWVLSGSHRINRAHPSATGQYDQSDAVQIMDAWWPLLVKAEFGPVLGSVLLSDLESRFAIDDGDRHGHLGSAWDNGFYGIVQQDLRDALGYAGPAALNRVYCGGGSPARCRQALDASLLAAASETPDQVYPASRGCAAGDQMCYDQVRYTALGAVTEPPQEWVNRPTFQQAVEISSAAP